jgi:protein involved in polysaccharide export with SLBB domain
LSIRTISQIKTIATYFLVSAFLWFVNIIAFAETASLGDFPSTQTMESLKSTSSVVLTDAEFEAWLARQTINLTHDSQPIAKKTVSYSFNPKQPALTVGVEWLDYILKPGDTISIQILGHPELSRQHILIGSDNIINLPLLGKIAVTSMSLDSLRNDLSKKLAFYLRYPSVDASLDNIAPQRIFVLGAVKKPGFYRLDGQNMGLPSPPNSNTSMGDFHLSAALIKTGGVLADADLSHIKIINSRNLIRKQANLFELLAYGALQQDLPIGSEDLIYVPRLPDRQWNHPEVLKLLADSNLGQDTYPIRIYGLVNRPDVYYLIPGEMTLQTILAKAGIDVEKAQRKDIVIARTLPNQQMLAMKVDSRRKDTILYPNDVVIVARSNWKHEIKSLFGTFSSITMPAANLKYILDKGNSVTP